MTGYKQKKIAVINDLSGYGRCSLTVAIPIISALKVQCCPVPTSILSNHTGFPTYYFDDYTQRMKPYLEHWKKLQLTFDGILTGFLGSKEQIGLVIGMIGEFAHKDTCIIVDPIMGDHGRTYQTYTPDMCREMKRLVHYGSIVTPNLTEGCILADMEYHKNGWKRADLEKMAGRIRQLGPHTVILTGIPEGGFLTNGIFCSDAPPVYQRVKRMGSERSGTGDVFSSIIAANAVLGVPLKDSVRQAAVFVKNCIQKSEELQIPTSNGVCFEELLSQLTKSE